MLAACLTAIAAQAVADAPPQPPPATAPASAPATTAPSRAQAAMADPRIQDAGRLLVRGQYEQARALLLAVMADFKDNIRAELFLALTYHKEKHYDLARPHYERIIRLHDEQGLDFKEFPATYYFQGWCLYYLGLLPESRASFEKHVELQPKEAADSLFGLALIDLEDDKLDDAERRFLQSIRMQENNPRLAREVAKAHARVAEVYLRREQLEKARDHLVTATSMYPDHYTAWYKLYQVLTRLGDADAAAAAMAEFRAAEQRVRPETGERREEKEP
jgi:Tfp pilus assembly protein PilF